MYSDSKVLAQFVDVGGDVSYLQEAASDIYTGRLYVFGFGFLFSIVSAAILLIVVAQSRTRWRSIEGVCIDFRVTNSDRWY